MLRQGDVSRKRRRTAALSPRYDQEIRDRAVRMYQDRRRDFSGESALQARRRVGQPARCQPDTLRGWIERVEIDAGQRPGVPSPVEARIKELERENAELRRANEILKTSPAFSAAAELDPRPPTALIVDYVTPTETASGSSRSAGFSPSTSWRGLGLSVGNVKPDWPQRAHLTWPRCRGGWAPAQRAVVATHPGQSVFQLRVTLDEVVPTVWRRLLVPGGVRLGKLHGMLQAAMGGTGSHLHSFTIGDQVFGTHFDDYPDERLRPL